MLHVDCLELCKIFCISQLGEGEPARLWPRKLPGRFPCQVETEGWGAVAVVRGVAVSPGMGSDRCYAVEIAFESAEDYALALMARVVKDDCGQTPVKTEQGSGVCAFHLTQINERRRVIE